MHGMGPDLDTMSECNPLPQQHQPTPAGPSTDILAHTHRLCRWLTAAAYLHTQGPRALDQRPRPATELARK